MDINLDNQTALDAPFKWLSLLAISSQKLPLECKNASLRTEPATTNLYPSTANHNEARQHADDYSDISPI